MQVLLISVNRETEPYPVEPIGVAYVAAALSKAGHEVALLDLCFEDDAAAAIKRLPLGFIPGVIGISIRNIDNLTYPKSVFYLPAIREVVRNVRSVCNCPIIAGGSGFSLFPHETIEYLGVDYGLIGEGEASMVAFVRRVELGSGFDGVPGLIGRGLDRFCPPSLITDFTVSSPARELLDYPRYAEAGGMANVQTKRGCPFECVYCTYPFLEGKKLRLREPRSVADEIETLYRDRARDYFFFVDDIFNMPEGHAIGICEEIIKRRLDIRWACFCTPKGITSGLLKAMKAAGCVAIEFGTDGGTDATLEALGKGFTVTEIEKAQRLCVECGIEAAHYLILGGPGETKKTLHETFALMERIRPRAVIAMLGVRIYPGTTLKDLALKEGLIEKGASLLEPVFYISGGVKDSLLNDVSGWAAGRPNWVVPGLGIRSGAKIARTLAQMGKKGVMWDMLGS